ncbi:MAG: peptide chain release factor N(5)-glutamine methyltransferase [Actinobacteria bacterium]|nr:peptide chain release factor N(5)-glutamine methyltransferase [Actinomycetota bacterium]
MAASVGGALRAATQWLRASGSRSPRLDAELLLATALGVGRTELFRTPERVLTGAEERRFDGYLMRRQAREPVAYIRGRRAFRALELEVTPAVLIPRPETETLVDVALEALAAVPAGAGGAATPGFGPERAPGPGGAAAPGLFEPVALDVGTGSGCIALALAAENPFVRVLATDVSEAALEVARRNAARLGLGGRVDIRLGDLLADLPARMRFDVIVSNPPYIPAAEYRALEPNVRDYEPRLALDGGEDGLAVLRRLIPAAAARLRPGGVLAVEVGAGQAAAVRALFAAAGAFRPAEARADLAGIPRVVFARLSAGDGGG